MPFARKRARTKPTRLSFSWRDGCRRWRPPGPGGSHVSQETVEKPAYATLQSILGRSQGAKRRLDGVAGPHLPASRGATDKLGDTARAENWRNPKGAACRGFSTVS